MATPTLDFGAFSSAEKSTLLTAAKAEYLKRITGRVQSGSSAAQSYSFTQMTLGELVNLINGLTDELGLTTVETRVRPNFNKNPYPFGMGPTSEDSDVASNSLSETDEAGNIIITAESANHTAVVEVTDAAPGTKVVALATSGGYSRNPGDRLMLRFEMPAVAGILIQIRNSSFTGTVLYEYETDGSGADNFVADLYFDGTSYKRFEQAVPVV